MKLWLTPGRNIYYAIKLLKLLGYVDVIIMEIVI